MKQESGIPAIPSLLRLRSTATGQLSENRDALVQARSQVQQHVEDRTRPDPAERAPRPPRRSRAG
jgi:hypothetical protein